jgi:hypothetical protein
MFRSPLLRTAMERDFFSLVLAECALYGVPPDAIGLFRDLHAMLGWSEPLGEKQVAALSGPTVAWRTFPNQPHFERVVDVERLAFHQRALIAFGGGAPGEMVGRAEIVTAMGNLIDDGEVPPEYIEIFRWASVDTLSAIQGHTKEQVLAQKDKAGWKAIPDDDVVNPAGRLYATYQEICTSIRRETIAALEKAPMQHPRNFLRPWAAQFIDNHGRVREEAVRENLIQVIAAIDRQVEAIRRMFPDLGSFDEELANRSQVVERALEDLGP